MGLIGLGSGVGVVPVPASAGGQAPAQAVPFIQDDYPAALARARAEGLPLFVEAWAPW